MSFQASDGDNENLNSVFFAIHEELSLGHDMSGCESHVWSPPFSGSEIRGVDNEFPGGFIINGSGLEIIHIGAMR